MSRTTITLETRRLQKALAVLIACHCAVEEGAEFDVGDALTVVVGLLQDSIAGLDQLQLEAARDA